MMTDNDVTARFNQAMIHTYQEALKIGYKPTRFLQMVNEHGGVETARIILAQANTTDGFSTLWEKQRLDLSVEALILQPDYATLFTAEDKAKARARLAEVNYTAPWDSAVTSPSATVVSAAPSLVDRLAHAVAQTGGNQAEDDEDDDITEPLAPFGTLEHWQRKIVTSHPLGKQLTFDYPAWLTSQFQDRVLFVTGTKQRLMIDIDERFVQQLRINDRKGAEVWFTNLSNEQVARLRQGLAQPQSLAQKPSQTTSYPNHWRFNVESPQDIELVKDLMLEIAASLQLSNQRPLQPPIQLRFETNTPIFVITFRSNNPFQTYGSSYAFSPAASGDVKKLRDAAQNQTRGGPAPVLFLYRPGPRYAFSAWATVRGSRTDQDPNGVPITILDLDQHELEPDLALKGNAASLRTTIPWLADLKQAFNYRSIRRITAEDATHILNLGDQIGAGPMSIADAAHTILTRSGGGPLHLTEILKQIQEEELAAMRGQTPQLSLASIMLRDERFQNLGRNTWILAASAQDDEDTEDDIDPALIPTSEPPHRQPKIYAESDAQFWRIHFPRELWATARRAGVIAINWPLDSGNQSVKRFQKIRPGDRIVAYVQGGMIGGIGIAISAFDSENPGAGLPADILGEEYNQFIRIAWADAPADSVDLLDALRHPNYTQLYNRIKNPHTVMPLTREDYTLVLSLLQVDDIGSQNETRLPNALTQLATYINLALSLGSADFESTSLVDSARALDPPAAEPLDADDLVAELLQLRLIEASSPTSYRLRDYVTGERAMLLKLCALAVLMPVEGTADQYMLPARAILPRLRTATTAQPADRFAPELGADGLVLLGWYAEAGLVEVEDESWQVRPDTLDLGNGTDRASQTYRSFLRTMLAEIDGVLETDLAHVAFDAPLPSVTDFEARVRLLGQELLFDTAIVRRVYRSLLAGRHVVLSGPPGTGKTELARLLPSLLWGEEPRVYQRLTVSPSQPPVDEVTVQRSGYASVIVTATEDWGVRDVVGGIGPRLNAQSGLSYTIEHGALTRVLLQHYDGTESGRRMPPANAPLVRRDHRPTENQRYRGAWLVIDEFTRAPIDAAFGSLLTTLSGSEHAKLAVPTASGELREVPLPRDFRIIGTLNSFDRHFLNQISEAMKRRFDFIDVLPPPPSYAVFEQGIAAKQALSRLQRQGFTQITSSGDPATYTWPQVLQVVPTLDSQGLQRYQWQTDLPEADAALTSFWRLFSAIRVFRQLGTAQIVAIYMNLLTGVLVDMNWQEALDTSLADALADQLQVLNRDEQQIIEAFVRSAGEATEFCTALRAILSRVPAGRRVALRAALRDADQLSNVQQQSDIALDQTALSDEQIARVFALGAPLALPPISVFQRRLRDLAGERGL